MKIKAPITMLVLRQMFDNNSTKGYYTKHKAQSNVKGQNTTKGLFIKQRGDALCCNSSSKLSPGTAKGAILAASICSPTVTALTSYHTVTRTRTGVIRHVQHSSVLCCNKYWMSNPQETTETNS